MSSDFLFATPTFLRGVASIVDIGGTAEDASYNVSRTPNEADVRAIASDWIQVGRDIDRAIKATKLEPASR
jgi:hypothetical protein